MLSIWASLQGWFTPTVFFILINLGIAIVAIFSIAQRKETRNAHQLTRTTSLLERFRSFNIYRQNTQELLIPPIIADPEPPLETVETVEMVEPHDQTHLSRIHSDTHPTAGEMPEKLPQKMKKSTSENSAFDHFHEEKKMVSDGGPSEMRQRRVLKEEEEEEEDEEEVNVKADDFINRFKQQLKLQRLDSFLRYREMLRRGT